MPNMSSRDLEASYRMMLSRLEQAHADALRLAQGGYGEGLDLLAAGLEGTIAAARSIRDDAAKKYGFTPRKGL
jgi:hypothetical protein